MALPKSIKYKINENTRICTDFYDVAEPYKLFKKLDVQGIVELEEVDFYGGYRRTTSDQFMASSSAVRAEIEKERTNAVRSTTCLTTLLNNFTSGHICFVGPAGIGKTTLLKSIARDVLSGKYDGLQGIEVVHFIQCRHYALAALLDVGEFLFTGTGMDETEIQTVERFGSEYPGKILFILDSLDTLQYSPDGVYAKIGFKEKTGTDGILWNFLSEKLFPGCRIITSSREHSIRNYVGDLRPQKVIALLGFENNSIEKVIAGYVGEAEAKSTMQHLEEKLPDLLVLCRTPVILVYTVVGLGVESSLNPATLTRIMVIVLQSILRSPHAHQTDILEVMYKLQELAHAGNIQGRVLFFPEDFKNVGLEPETAADLAVFAPGGRGQKLMEGESLLFFTHQTYQELLGALWVAGRDIQVFKDLAETIINDRRFAVIRRFLCGILLDREVYDALRHDLLQADVDYEEKVQYLKEILQLQLQSRLDERGFLELFVSMNETKDNGINEVIQSSIREVDLLDIPLSLSDVYAMGSVISRCNRLNQLDLCNCSLDESSMKTLASTLKESNLKLPRLILSENKHMGTGGMSAAGEIVTGCSTEELILSSCNLSNEQMQALADSTRNTKMLAKIHLDGNENLGTGGMSAVGEIVTHCDTRELDLRRCGLSSDKLRAFAKSTRKAKALFRLHLSENTKLGIGGMNAAGGIVTQCNIQILNLSVCKLSFRQLETLADSTKFAKSLRTLNLAEDRDASHEDIVAVSALFPNVSESVQMFRWRISEADKIYLQDKLEEMNKKDFQVRLSTGLLAGQTIQVKTTSETETLDDQRTNLSAEIDRRIKTKSTNRSTVGPDGGTVENAGCKVTFFAGALEKDTEVETSVITDLSDCPKGRVPITPIFQCKPAGILNQPALLQLESWAFPINAVTAEVFRKDTEDSEWQFVETIAIEQNTPIRFHAKHFTFFEVVVELATWFWTEIQRPFVTVSLENIFYIGGIDRNIACVSCLKQTKVMNDVITSLRNAGYSPLLPVPETMLASRNGMVKFAVRCVRPRTLELVLEGDDEDMELVDRVAEKIFPVREIITTCKATHYFPVRLRDGELKHHKGDLRFKVSLATDQLEVNHTVSKAWPISDVENCSSAVHHHYYGDIKANTVVMR